MLCFQPFRYITVLPPINLQHKVDILQHPDTFAHDTESISKFYQDFSKELRWASRSDALELAVFVKIIYLITGMFIIVTVYLIYHLLSKRKKFKPNRLEFIQLLAPPIFLNGHEKVRY